MKKVFSVAAALWLLLIGVGHAEEKILCDFENDVDLKLWEMSISGAAAAGTLSDQHVAHGQKSLKVVPGQKMTSWSLPQDWSGFDSLDVDAFVDGDDPVNGGILVGDKPWKDQCATVPSSNSWN